jgi:glycosyltransferase involved in cell wall biosynthesis
MNSRPTFSVVIPTHNRANLLPRAIHSVLNQTFKDFELLIVDDASTDNTKDVVKQFDDPRILFIAREENGGAAGARNTAISHASGKYVSLLDDDDEYLSDFLESTLHAFEGSSEDIGFSWCGVRWMKDTEKGQEVIKDDLWQPKFRNREHAYLSFLRHRRVGTNCGITIRRSVFESVGIFDELLNAGAEDTDFLIRLVRSYDFIVIPRILLKVYLHKGPSLRTYGFQKAQDYQRIMLKNAAALEKHPDLWTSLHYKTGWLFYHGGSKEQGRASMWQAIRKNPFYAKAWAGLLFFETLGAWAPPLHKKISTMKESLSGAKS